MTEVIAEQRENFGQAHARNRALNSKYCDADYQPRGRLPAGPSNLKAVAQEQKNSRKPSHSKTKFTWLSRTDVRQKENCTNRLN
jgi:hypothetical protein